MTKKKQNKGISKDDRLLKREPIIYDESGNIFSLDFIINKISKRECLLCKTNLDANIGEGKWHIPLCKTHRLREINKKVKNDYKLRELDDTEKKILNILIEDAHLE